MITGTFEIHITINVQSQTRLLVLIEELKRNKDWMIRPRMTQVSELYGDHMLQPMFACFLHDDSENALHKLLELGKLMQTRGINVLRLKLESAANNQGVPAATTDDDYFEFHFDIPIMQDQIANEWNNLVIILTPFGCHLSHNLNKHEIIPIATLRHYGSLVDIQNQFEEIKKVLHANQYEYIKLQREYSVFDSCVGLDKGWVYVDDPRVPITTLSHKMLLLHYPESLL